MTHIVCFGEMLLRIGSPGSEPLLRSPALEGYVGGAEANVAASLASFGHRARMVTALPEGPLGDACLAELRRHDVDTSAIRRAPGRLGLYFLAPGATQRASRVIYDRADSVFAMTPASGYDWPKLLDGARWLHVTGITPALSEEALSALGHAVDAANSSGVRVAFDCNFRPSLWRGREGLAARVLGNFAKRANLLIGGPLDVAHLFSGGTAAAPGSTAPDGLQAFAHATGIAFAACSKLEFFAGMQRSVRGADHHDIAGYVASRSEITASQTLTVQPIVDRIGTGDAFAAGVIHGLSSDLSPQRTTDFALAAAALKHGVKGDFSPFSAADVAAALDGNAGDVRR